MYIVAFLLSAAAFIISYFQFQEKGFLFSNAYRYTVKRERDKINKTPYYRQSAIIFVFIGIIFLLNAMEMILNIRWLFYVTMIFVVMMFVYAIASSVFIEGRKKK